ncbi:MAG: regulatory protein RecX, partial [Persicimonas sp.]
MTDEDDSPTLADVEAKAMRLLSRRAHAEGELRRKLRKKDFPDELIDEACAKMREYGYLDDAAFAEDQAAMLARKGWGPRQIEHKLGKRGVDEAIIDEALRAVGDRDTWLENCRARLRTKYRCEPDDLDRDAQEKAFRHLKYRGFHAS